MTNQSKIKTPGGMIDQAFLSLDFLSKKAEALSLSNKEHSDY